MFFKSMFSTEEWRCVGAEVHTLKMLIKCLLVLSPFKQWGAPTDISKFLPLSSFCISKMYNYLVQKI